MEAATLKRLASLVAAEPAVSDGVRRFVTERLSKKDAKTFAFYLRREMARRTVTVHSASDPSPAARGRFAALFPGKDVTHAVDANLGGGFTLEYDDMLVRADIAAVIERAYDRITTNL